MNVNEVVERVQSTFGDENEAMITVPTIIRWVNSGQRKLARETKCLQTDVDVAINATANGVNLPSDFVNMARATYLGVVIRETTLQYLTQVEGDTDVLQGVTNDPPTFFYIWARKLYLYPWPKIISPANLHIWYTRLPVEANDLNDTLEIPDYMHEDIVQYCLVEAHKLNADWSAAQTNNNDLRDRIAQSKEEADNPVRDSYPSVRMYDGDLW